jgi:hypothetical protein
MKIRSSFVLLTFGLIIFGCASRKYHGSSKWIENNSITIVSDNLNGYNIITKNKNVEFTASEGESLQINKCKRKNCLNNESSRSATTSDSKSSTLIFMENFKRKGVDLYLTHPNYDTIKIEIKRRVRYDALAKDISLSLITYGIPLMVDAFKSDFYRVRKNSQKMKVHFEYRQSFMKDEYLKIANSMNPNDFKDWISKYPKSEIKKTVINKKDSVELLIAISKGQESAIDEFINSHKESNFLDEATLIKKEMVDARELFKNACIKNNVEAYEDFLSKYPNSLHNKEAHLKLVDASEKRALDANSSEKVVEYIIKYLKPNVHYITELSLEEKKGKSASDIEFLAENKLDVRKSRLTKALQSLIIKESVTSNSTLDYSSYSKMWKKYIALIDNKDVKPFIGEFSDVESYRDEICNILFNSLKEANTKEKQNKWKEKTLLDFPKFTKENITNRVLALQTTGSGIIKLYDANFIRNADIGYRYHIDVSKGEAVFDFNGQYTYKGQMYECLSKVNIEELNFSKGKLSGVCKGFTDNIINVSITFGENSRLKDISYYQNGKLVKTTYYPDDYHINNFPSYTSPKTNENDYSYEFENGVNITLKELDRKNEEGNALLKKEAFTEAISLLENARDNNFPTSLAQNIAFDKSIANAKKLYATYQKKQEEIRLTQERKSIQLPSNAIYSQVSNHVFVFANAYGDPTFFDGIATFIIFHSNKKAQMLMGNDVSSAIKHGVLKSGTWYTTSSGLFWIWQDGKKTEEFIYNSNTNNFESGNVILKNLGSF